MTPKEVLQAWLNAFNRADVEALANLYHPEAINHQVANEPVAGREAIKELFRREFAAAEMICRPEHVFEDGEWAIMEWKDPQGLRGCGFFQVRQGQILLQRGYWDKLSFYRLHNIQLPVH
jgi:limonene-1,2-epoxide hydrolase